MQSLLADCLGVSFVPYHKCSPWKKNCHIFMVMNIHLIAYSLYSFFSDLIFHLKWNRLLSSALLIHCSLKKVQPWISLTDTCSKSNVILLWCTLFTSLWHFQFHHWCKNMARAKATQFSTFSKTNMWKRKKKVMMWWC